MSTQPCRIWRAMASPGAGSAGAEFQRRSYNATGLDRWAERFQCEYVLMADADMLVAADFSDAVEQLPQTYPSEAADMRIFHYLNGPFRKHSDTSGTQSVASWLEAHRNDPNPHTQMIADVVGKAHQEVMVDLSDTGL